MGRWTRFAPQAVQPGEAQPQSADHPRNRYQSRIDALGPEALAELEQAIDDRRVREITGPTDEEIAETMTTGEYIDFVQEQTGWDVDAEQMDAE